MTDSIVGKLDRVTGRAATVYTPPEDLIPSDCCACHGVLKHELRTLLALWTRDVNEANDAGIETPTMPIRAAIAAVEAIVGREE